MKTIREGKRRDCQIKELKREEKGGGAPKKQHLHMRVKRVREGRKKAREVLHD